MSFTEEIGFTVPPPKTTSVFAKMPFKTLVLSMFWQYNQPSHLPLNDVIFDFDMSCLSTHVCLSCTIHFPLISQWNIQCWF